MMAPHLPGLQSDGNLVVYNAGGSPLWSSNTAPSVPPASMCINRPNFNTFFCPAGSWWHTCQAPSYDPYAAFNGGDSNVVVTCTQKCGTGCLHAGTIDNQLCQGGSAAVRTCWNDNGTLRCTPADPC